MSTNFFYLRKMPKRLLSETDYNDRMKRIAHRIGASYKPSTRYLSANSSRQLNRRGVASKETGYVDLAFATYNLDTTGSIALVATIAQGASVNQRVGKKIMLKSLQVRGYLQNGAASYFNDCAVILVYDRRPTGSLPAITDVLVTANSSAFNNDANSGRFKIIRRWDFELIGNVTGTLATQQLTDCTAKTADDFVKLKGLPTVFKAAGTGAIGDIEEGALYVITVGNNVAGTTAAQANLAFRTRFVDV